MRPLIHEKYSNEIIKGRNFCSGVILYTSQNCRKLKRDLNFFIKIKKGQVTINGKG